MKTKNSRRNSRRYFFMIACLLTIFVWLKFIVQTTVKILTAYATFHWADVVVNLLFSSLLTWALFYFNWKFNRHMANQIRDHVKLFKKNPHPMWVYDLKTLRFLKVNEAATALYGYSAEEFKSMTIKDIGPAEDVPLLISANEEAKLNFNHEYHWSGTWRHKIKSGKLLYVEISSHDIIFEGKKAELVLAYNVTDKVMQDHKVHLMNQELESKVIARTNDLLQLNKRLIDQNRIIKSANLELFTVTNDLKEANQKIQEHADMKNRFVSMASHEFRIPLSNISSSATFIKRHYKKLESEEILEKTESIERHVTNMLSLLDDMLTIGKADGIKLKTVIAPIDIGVFAKGIINEVETACKGSHQVHLKMHHETMPPISSSEAFLRNIFINLLSNAIKYSPQCKDVSLEIYLQDNAMCFMVTDRGMGIAPQELQRIFEPFYRCTTTKNISGAGLGLSIVKRAADALNAKVTVESEIGAGTTFKVLLPVN